MHLFRDRSYFGTVIDFNFEKDCGHIRPADDDEPTVFFLGVVVTGDKAATIYKDASVEFSVTKDGGDYAFRVRSRRYGTVVWLDNTGDYGYIEPADGGEDIYFHQTNAIHRINARVEFLVREDGQGRPEAYDVRRVGGRRYSGTVVFANNTIGFGLIQPADGGLNIFVHQRNAIDRLRSSESVEFLVRKDSLGGIEAYDVRSGRCYSCGEFGHMKRDCPTGNNRGGGGRRCYNCGEFGHMARNCPTGNNSGGGGGCNICGKGGHMTRLR